MKRRRYFKYHIGPEHGGILNKNLSRAYLLDNHKQGCFYTVII